VSILGSLRSHAGNIAVQIGLMGMLTVSGEAVPG
jgi:hypothetical protein